ncbi:MAG: outer membrane protein assembly factor BamE [Magnetococcales bacterium]|nr:outer membrane protein assembly factor BamE [Magnetococcales bacterium]
MTKPFLNLPRIIFFILLIALAGCQARLQDTGTMIKPEDINKIVVGVTSFQEVKKLLGPATIVNTFRRERWIYIQDRRYKNLQRTFSRAANRIEITFNNQGIVEKIERNFGESLIDPEKDKYSELKSRWGSWFWDGGYERPADQQQETPETEGDVEAEGEESENDTEGLISAPITEDIQENKADSDPNSDTTQDKSVKNNTDDEINEKDKMLNDNESQKAKAWWRFW